jgi:hypothetical protein
MRQLQQFTESVPLLDMGLDDLLAFRDTEQLETGVGDTIFRETFPTLMLSATIARCYAKPRGFPDDDETIATIYRNEPEGDGRLGPLIDRWFLDRPICRTRRASRDAMRASLEQIVRAQPAGAAVRIASLASGAAAELFELCASAAGSAVLATCIDIDNEALLAGARRAERNGLAGRMTFLHGNALPLDGENSASLPQTAIYALGLCEYLTDDHVVALLDRIFAGLVDEGTAIVSNLAAGNPDRGLMEHILDWKANHRTADAVRGLFARSPFGSRAVDISEDETGATLFARCVKTGSA